MAIPSPRKAAQGSAHAGQRLPADEAHATVSVDLVSLGALALVTGEWLALGWLSGVRFAQQAPAAIVAVANGALRVLIGASLVGLAQLVLALLGFGFGSVAAVLASAALLALAVRASRA